jgi:hypothetical protein
VDYGPTHPKKKKENQGGKGLLGFLLHILYPYTTMKNIKTLYGTAFYCSQTQFITPFRGL